MVFKEGIDSFFVNLFHFTAVFNIVHDKFFKLVVRIRNRTEAVNFIFEIGLVLIEMIAVCFCRP